MTLIKIEINFSFRMPKIDSCLNLNFCNTFNKSIKISAKLLINDNFYIKFFFVIQIKILIWLKVYKYMIA